jgi:hypothetical protein
MFYHTLVYCATACQDWLFGLLPVAYVWVSGVALGVSQVAVG